MIGKIPPPRIRAGDELTVKWLNAVRDTAVEGSILDLGAGLVGSPTPNGWAIGADVADTAGIYFCLTPSSGTWGATGSWPTLTAGTFTADVYEAEGSTLTKIATSAAIFNWFPSTPANSKVTMLFLDGTGSFVVGPQSCT